MSVFLGSNIPMVMMPQHHGVLFLIFSDYYAHEKYEAVISTMLAVNSFEIALCKLVLACNSLYSHLNLAASWMPA